MDKLNFEIKISRTCAPFELVLDHAGFQEQLKLPEARLIGGHPKG